MTKNSQKSDSKKEETPSEVLYQGQIWKVTGTQSGAQGAPWLQLKRGFFSAIAKDYEVENKLN